MMCNTHWPHQVCFKPHPATVRPVLQSFIVTIRNWYQFNPGIINSRQCPIIFDCQINNKFLYHKFEVVNYDGVSKNVTAVGFHEDGKWMYTGGEDCSARIWDLRQVFPCYY